MKNYIYIFRSTIRSYKLEIKLCNSKKEKAASFLAAFAKEF